MPHWSEWCRCGECDRFHNLLISEIFECKPNLTVSLSRGFYFSSITRTRFLLKSVSMLPWWNVTNKTSRWWTVCRGFAVWSVDRKNKIRDGLPELGLRGLIRRCTSLTCSARDVFLPRSAFTPPRSASHPRPFCLPCGWWNIAVGSVDFMVLCTQCLAALFLSAPHQQ